jgi:cold-inducible RNA-binding protein
MKKIYVGNFGFDLKEPDLRSMFEPFGSVESVTLVTDRDTGRSRGFGFVEMSEDGAANSAIEKLNGSDSGGRPLTVNEARPKTEHGSRGGGGRDQRSRQSRW